MKASTKDAIRTKLQEVFDYDHFREEQEAIIKNVLDGKNTFVIMPTGGGKSLCYQIPALMQPGVTIVISPLIALMKNQVDQLLSRGVHAAFLNSTLSKKTIEEIKSDVLSGKTKLLYVAPESLIKAENLAFLKQASISFIAVDEAHCISDWGHDFRPEYRKIKSVLDQELGPLPMIALTATATPKVRQDILKNLEIEDATLFQSSFNRENLYYEVRHKSDVERQLITFIKDQPDHASGVIYCQSRKKVEELADLLNLNGIRAAPYHAGLEAKVREQNQDAFLSQEVDVIVATIAFGMGIDKPDVRFVIHHDVPRSLEGYYQETGRAGRDGQPSTCLMFYSAEDLNRLERFNSSKPGAEREKAQTLLQAMGDYVASGVCRRKQLLHYFGEVYEGSCGNCDNSNNPTQTFAGEDFVHLVLTAVQQTQERFGANHIICLLMGIEDAYIKSYRHQELSSFGQGNQQDEAFWKSVIRQALLLELLSQDMTQSNILKLTKKGQAFLKQQYPIALHEDRVYDEAPQAPLNSTSQEEGHHKALLALLHKTREQVAKEKKVPIYAVVQDTSLEEMALVYPTSLDALAQISGMGVSKAKKFGEPFVALIQKYVADHDIIAVSDIVVKSVASRSKNKVYIIQQVDRKIDLEEIAAAKSLTMDELLKEMEQLCYAGTKLNIGYYINTILDTSQQEEVYDYFMQATTDSIKVAFKELEEDYEEEELRLMRIKFLSEVAN